MKKAIFTTFILVLICNNIYSNPYPISPRPLRQLVMESNLIVVGDVIKVYKNGSQEQTENKKGKKKKKRIYESTYSIARIVIKEILQGKISKDTIEISFEPNMICPAPARYFENTTVLTFLDDNNGQYSTHALSYGAKTLDSTGVRVYIDRIKEIQTILNNKNPLPLIQQEETIEWLVKCAENPTTRWEGVFELSPESNFMSFYSKEHNKTLKNYLSEEQKRRLKKALELSSSFDYYDFGLSDLIYLDNQKEIEELLLAKLKKLTSDNYWYASDFMIRLKHLKDSAEMENLLKKQSDIELTYNNDSERKKIIDDFISLIEH